MSVNAKQTVSLLPEKPGVYLFTDNSGNIVYVGKAKNLRKRVSSYFTKNQTGKTTIMLKKATEIKHIVVDNESDALLLENNLIKKHQPRYNILLKDDKTFPWICITGESFPRVFSTRNTIRNGSVYFGPYTSGLMVKTLLNLIRHLFKLRICSLHLTEENVKSGKFKVCLEYHIGNCKAPCIGLQSKEEYSETILQVKNILKGNMPIVLSHLKNEMRRYSEKLQFEEAQIAKEKIELLAKFQSKSTVVSTTIKNVDVFGIARDTDRIYINFLKVINGAVIQAFTLAMKPRVDEETESLLGFAITEIRQRLSSNSPEIIVPIYPDIMFEKLKYIIPVKGDKHKLLELAERNAIYYKLEQRKKLEDLKPKDRTLKNLEKLKTDLHMAELPVHIECFDNSNTMGKNPVAACVVFKMAKPSKKDYRHFNIKTVTGPDDYSSMEEIVYRRYKRTTEENTPLPQLIIIDGGKGQLSSAGRSLRKLGLHEKITIIGIAKKLEEIYFPGDSVPLYLDKNSVSLKIIQQLRNEAHRFGINFHRNKRSAEMTKSDLDEIKGIGIKTRETLFRKIGSVEKIRNTPIEILKNLIGEQKAAIIKQFFNN